MMKLLSLFDGSGGFCFAALRAGIKPVAASEIEPFPIRVTTKRLPQIKHLGDVREIDGGKIEPVVDIVTFGSPCTDLSVSGKRAGLFGEKSSLFFQAIRVIKEMRTATKGKNPRFIIFENVCGVFSSDKGKDFQKILTEIIRIKEPTAPAVPLPEKGKWARAGTLLGEGFSVAYRVFDAQFWGVPQRRKRIYLVADFAGDRAGKILFESKGLRRNFAESCGTWKNSATEVKKGVGNQYVEEGKLQVDKNSVRRLTPTECARLQGFPDYWCSNLETENPSEEEINFWKKVFKNKSETQIRRWLKNPHSDSAEYKMWGNGIALPCAEFILKKISDCVKK